MRSFSISAIILLGCLLLAACQAGPNQQTQVHLQARFPIPEGLEGYPPGTEEMEYLVWLPESYGREVDMEYPLIFFLHGSGSSEYDSSYVMSYGLPEVLLTGEQPETFEFVVVSPQAFDGTAWWEGDQLSILDALLDEVIEKYQVDPQRVYLTGLSMGGYGAWWLATRQPERFAAMVSVSGSGYRSLSVPQKVYCRLAGLPVWVIHGKQDRISSPTAITQVAMILKSCGGEVAFSMYEEEDHFGAYARAYRDPQVYAWMLAHVKE